MFISPGTNIGLHGFPVSGFSLNCSPGLMYLSLLWAQEIPCLLFVPVSQVPPQWLHDLLEDKSNCCHSSPPFGVRDISTCLIAASLPLMYSTKSVTFVLEPNNRLYPGGPGGPGGPCGPRTSLSLMCCSMSCSRP